MRSGNPDFRSLGFSPDLVNSLKSYGFDSPSILIMSILEPLRSGRNVIAVGHARCGKTVTGLVAILSQIDIDLPKLQAIFLTPTKSQAASSHRKLVELSSALRVKSIFSCGGTDPREDAAIMKNDGIQVLLATPGRFLDFIRRKQVCLDAVNLMVIDKAELFTKYSETKQQVEQSISIMPERIQYVVFTNKLTEETQNMLRVIARNSVFLRSISDAFNMNCGSHYYFEGDLRDKVGFLRRVFNGPPKKIVIYCNSVETLDFVEGLANESEIDDVIKIFEEIPGPQLFNYLKNMQRGNYSVVVATNKLKFAIDVRQVDYVIIFETSGDPNDLFERLSSKFAGKQRGRFIHLTSEGEKRTIQQYLERNGATLTELPEGLL